MLWWISWYQPTEDYRPLADPPNPNIIGWWCSGYRFVQADNEDGEQAEATICALVCTETEDQAKAAILIDWPEAKTWRFCEENEFFQPSDRFPLIGWARERFENWRTTASPRR